MFVFPLAATLLAAAFTWGAWHAGRRSRHVALEVWAFALLQFTIASVALTVGVAVGWSADLYRTYYVLGAVTNVGWLGLGTIWLLTPRRVAFVATVVIGAASVYAATLGWTEPLVAGASAALFTDVPHAGEVLSPAVRLWSRIFSIGGSLIVIVGLGWSIVMRRREAVGLLLLVGGVVVVGVAGEFARAGFVLPFSVGLATGIGIMYLGFLRTTAGSAAVADEPGG